MSCLSFPERFTYLRRLLAAASGLLLSASGALAAPEALRPFAADTWNELARSPQRPQAVVFSTRDCTHCPGVIDSLAQSIKKSGAKARLVVVVMDGAGLEADLLKDRHYRQADVLYAFDGDAVSLRYRVNPGWRGLTPYVILVPAQGEPQFFSGAPPTPAVRDFLRP